MNLVGRKSEVKTMKAMLSDERAHFLALVGRRRVGKTFLIRRVFQEHKRFEMTGLKDADLHTQLANFTLQMRLFFDAELDVPKNWLMAFHELKQALLRENNPKKWVVFFDELPWIASKRSGFTEALAHWWNNWASEQNIIVVVCGSATSWMLQNIVQARGGLHNRITKLISLHPFTLSESREFLLQKNIDLSHHHIIQLYLSLGGIPHYLDQIPRGRSVPQIIQELCFEKDGLLHKEFDNLYLALFDNAQNHIKVIKALASSHNGLDRQAILKKTGISDGGWFSDLLYELESSGFISTVEPFHKKKKDTLYRLTDEYSLFYLTFIEGEKKKKSANWMALSSSQKYKIWSGYAFENLCFKHANMIKKALGISGIHSSVYSFLHRANDEYPQGAQIDMLIDRNDNVISLCEIKFHNSEFAISAQYAEEVRLKMAILRAITKTKKAIHLTFISSYGIVSNKHALGLVDAHVEAKDLF